MRAITLPRLVNFLAFFHLFQISRQMLAQLSHIDTLHGLLQSVRCFCTCYQEVGGIHSPNQLFQREFFDHFLDPHHPAKNLGEKEIWGHNT